MANGIDGVKPAGSVAGSNSAPVENQMLEILNNPVMSPSAKTQEIIKTFEEIPDSQKKDLYDLLSDKGSKDHLAKLLHEQLPQTKKAAGADAVLKALNPDHAMPQSAPVDNKPNTGKISKGNTIQGDDTGTGVRRAILAQQLDAKSTGAQATGEKRVLDWYGDKNNSLVPKSGYLEFGIAKDKGGTAFPDKIKLAKGEAHVESKGGGEYHITNGKQKLIAMKEGNQFSFYEPAPPGSFKEGDVNLGGNGRARPVPSNSDLPGIFTESMRVANGELKPRMDPKIEKTQQDLKLLSDIDPIRKKADHLVEDSKRQHKMSLEQGKALTEELGPLATLSQKGLLKMTEKNGVSQFELQRPGGMKNDEWKKIQAKFGPQLAAKEQAISGLQRKAVEGKEKHNAAAAELWRDINKPEMKKYLSMLPSEKRLKEFNRYAEALVGTPQGEQLGKELFGDNKKQAIDKGGVLKPGSNLAETVLKGSYDSPAAQEELKQLTLTMAPHIPGPMNMKGPWSAVRMFEVNMGRQLSNKERDAALKLANSGSPEKFAEQLKFDPSDSKIGAKAGTAADLLASLGGMSEVSVAGKELAINKGAYYLAKFSTAHAFYNLYDKGITEETVQESVGSSLRHIGMWGEVAGKSETKLLKAVKGLSVANDTVGLAMDFAAMLKPGQTEEGSRNSKLQFVASAALMTGAVIDAPLIAVAALGYKLFAPETSESYEKSSQALTLGLFSKEIAQGAKAYNAANN